MSVVVSGQGRGPLLDGWRRTAGVLYTLSWCAGLLVFSSDTSVSTSGAAVLAADTGHQAAVMTQFVLTQGLAGLLLVVIVGSISRAVGSAGSVRGTWMSISGGCAALVSLVQCALGVLLAVHLVPAGRVAAVGGLTRVIGHLDGVKMVALAVLVGAVSAAAGQRFFVLPGWLRRTGWVTTAALAVSAAGYLFSDDVLALAAWLSLPLLLVLVTGTALTLRRTTTDDRSGAGPTAEPDAAGDVDPGPAAPRSQRPLAEAICND